MQIGLWNSLCSPFATDVIADSGFDWILLDTEHAPNEIPNVLAQLQALTTSTATPIVRPAWNDTVLLKRVLDIGAQAVLVPFVQNAEEATTCRGSVSLSAVRCARRHRLGVAPAASAG